MESGCNCVCGVSGRNQRIVGGTRAVAHEFPWIATLSYNGTFYCGASLITPRHLLTAAHCLYGKSAKHIQVGLGDHNRNQDEKGELKKLRVSRAAMHPEFSISKIRNDIGIVELEAPVGVQGPTIRTVCLPTNHGMEYSGLDGVVAGWGRDKEQGAVATILRKVTLPLISREDCANKFGYCSNKILDTNFCAGLPKGAKDACQGDSGGPLHLNASGAGSHMELIGIVSWGRGCARPNYPGVYTRVDKYTSWINQQIGSECLCRPPMKN
ncbi:trypsin-1 [Halyomorpha halys]|uniref:trypsin-1 n=1 Tax=Halyomorpha halys TaxID=286706 RepID=UPI0006D4D7FE|nr:trypsin-1-like [Halyomorpha halys]